VKDWVVLWAKYPRVAIAAMRSARDYVRAHPFEMRAGSERFYLLDALLKALHTREKAERRQARDMRARPEGAGGLRMEVRR
jgi:hypothetical protein